MELEKIIEDCLKVEPNFKMMDGIVEKVFEKDNAQSLVKSKILFDAMIFMAVYDIEESRVTSVIDKHNGFEISKAVSQVIPQDLYQYYVNLFELEYASSFSLGIQNVNDIMEEVDGLLEGFEKANEELKEKLI